MKLLPLICLLFSGVALAESQRYIPDENHLSEDAIQEEQERQDVKILEQDEDKREKTRQHQEIRDDNPTYNSIDENLRENIQNNP